MPLARAAEPEGEPVKRKARWMAAAAAAIVALGTGTGIAVASAGDDDGADQPITGPALAEASRVARAETGGGRVVATEIRDEEGYYEVEVELDNGRHADVHLDQSFHVLDSSEDRGSDAGSP
jgi:uncharacterized membrane protein YkoI